MNPNGPSIDQQNLGAAKSQTLKFSEVWKVIKFRRFLIALIILLGCTGTFLGHFVYTPTFTATGKISIRKDKPKTMADVMGARTPWAEDNVGERISNYMHFIKSNGFLLEVAQSIKFKNFPQPLILEAPQNLSIFKVDFWYWAARHLVGQPALKPIKRHKIKYDPMSMSIEKIEAFLASVLRLESNYSDYITLKIKTLDPYTSMTLTNVLIKEFTRVTNEHDARGLLEVKKMLDNKLRETREALKKAELELIDFKKQNRISITGTQSAMYSARMNQVEKQIENINIKLQENDKLLSYYMKEQQKRLTADVTGQNEDSKSRGQITLLNQQLDALKRQKTLMESQNYPEDHWRMKEITESISQVAKELKGTIANSGVEFEATDDSNSNIQEKINNLKKENRSLNVKLGPLQANKKSLAEQLNKIPQAEQYQLMLERKVDLEYQNFSILRKKLSDIDIQLVSLDKKVIIDRLAGVPGPSKRRSLFLKLLFATLIGFFFGSMIALLLEYLDNSIRHKSDFEELGIHFLGEIPDTQPDNKSRSNIKSPTQLVTLNNPDSLDSVVFDFVRSRIESVRTRSGSSSNSLTITSVRPSEGKSFICSNLAVSLSQLGKKTLLIDADLRCPSVHCYFDLTNDQGLTDLFESDVSLDEIVHRNVVPNLDIFTAGWGCKNPTVLVSSEKFRIMMKFLRNEYDYIIVDTPPIGAVADASIISNMTDGIALVAKYRETTKHDLQEAQFKIHQMSNKRMFGIINFASNRENIVTYYPYVISKDMPVIGSPASPKNDDIQRFEEQLKRKRSG